MSWRDSDFAHLRGREDHDSLARKDFAFGTDDVNLNGCHDIELRLLQLLALLFGLFDAADHIERLLGQMIVVAVDDSLEASDRILE